MIIGVPDFLRNSHVNPYDGMIVNSRSERPHSLPGIDHYGWSKIMQWPNRNRHNMLTCANQYLRDIHKGLATADAGKYVTTRSGCIQPPLRDEDIFSSSWQIDIFIPDKYSSHSILGTPKWTNQVLNPGLWAGMGGVFIIFIMGEENIYC